MIPVDFPINVPIKIPFGLFFIEGVRLKDICVYAFLSFTQRDSSSAQLDFGALDETLGIDTNAVVASTINLIENGWIRPNLDGTFTCVKQQVPPNQREKVQYID